MVVTICIASAALVAITLTILLLRSRRLTPQNLPSRCRALMHDCGDDVVWQVGKLRPIIAPKEFQEQLSKRAFLKRVAFTVSAFSVAWLASRGKSVAFGSEKQTGENPLLGNGRARRDDPHNDSNTHGDGHSDGFGPDHGDIHSDSPGNHTDEGG